MSTLLKVISNDKLEFDINSSKLFATVVYERDEDKKVVLIITIKDGKVKQFNGNNKYNPSKRRNSTCIYIEEEKNENTIIKICTIEHKGNTLLEIHKVTLDELHYLFGEELWKRF